MRDDIATVRNIYRLADLPLTPDVDAALKRYADENRRGRSGQVVYDLEGDFGVTAAQLRERFRFYLDAFDLEED